ncbi:uncharacterized protein METZ01_LOCUS388474 [marine metagenome]|uniref:Methyltransferase domain-containing protein n=1 Tax=marine metagenome TaxID=408172 RepID=A0A382UN37_9ZZZZ
MDATGDTLKFLTQFIRHPQQAGAVMASGHKLCSLLARTAGVQNANIIVEFGTGTGAVTEEILKAKSETARLIGIEINRQFATETQERCPGAEIINDSVVRVGNVLTDRGLHVSDCIVSGLPWVNFSEVTQDEILDATVNALRPGGRLVTFAYLHGFLLPSARRFRSKLKERFSDVGMTRVVWANFPPAFVFWADKKRTAPNNTNGI